ncbi:hypothetical protein BEL04_16730 [Mucilaginibacter sp. PPCGB 2223]|nr:hypothetical protein BEL04_16730 [Mucilaginibacter sp. PPCGB 2223]
MPLLIIGVAESLMINPYSTASLVVDIFKVAFNENSPIFTIVADVMDTEKLSLTTLFAFLSFLQDAKKSIKINM